MRGKLLTPWLWCTLHTMESDSAVWCKLRSLTPRWDAHRGVWLSGRYTPRSFFLIEYLGETEKEFKIALACLSRVCIGSNHEKNRGRKSRDTIPLICHLLYVLYMYVYVSTICLSLIIIKYHVDIFYYVKTINDYLFIYLFI